MSMQSPLLLFKYMFIEDLHSATQDQIVKAYNHAKSVKDIWSLFGPLFVQDKNSEKVLNMRTILQVGGPLNVTGIRFNDINDRKEIQQNYVNSFMKELESHIEKEAKETFHPFFKTYLYNKKIQLDKYQVII